MASIMVESWSVIDCSVCGTRDEQVTMQLAGDTVSTTHMTCCGHIILDMKP